MDTISRISEKYSELDAWAWWRLHPIVYFVASWSFKLFCLLVILKVLAVFFPPASWDDDRPSPYDNPIFQGD